MKETLIVRFGQVFKGKSPIVPCAHFGLMKFVVLPSMILKVMVHFHQTYQQGKCQIVNEGLHLHMLTFPLITLVIFFNHPTHGK